MTEKRLKEIEELCEMCSHVPWIIDEQQTWYTFPKSLPYDAELIIQSSTIVPELLQEVRNLREALDKVIQHIGVPQPGYPAPIAYAYEIAQEALEETQEVKSI